MWKVILRKLDGHERVVVAERGPWLRRSDAEMVLVNLTTLYDWVISGEVVQVTPTTVAKRAEEAIDLYEMYRQRGMTPAEAKFRVTIDLMGETVRQMDEWPEGRWTLAEEADGMPRAMIVEAMDRR